MNDVEFLQKSFEEFNQATERLQRSYASLERKFEKLNRELEEKNIALEKAVAEKEDITNYLENILESLITGVVVTDPEGRVRTVNRCAEVYIGQSQKDLLGRSIKSLFADLSNDGAEAFSPAEYMESDAGCQIRMNKNIFEVFGSPVRARNGGVTGTVFIMRDITRIEKLEEMAKRTEKLVAMGEMAANFAHEIRNPLGSIELFASLLLRGMKNEKKREWVSHIISSVKNMDHKISNLLTFSRNRSPVFKRIGIHDVLKDVLSFTGQLVEQGGVTLSVRYADFEPMIHGDTELLKQVFLNLVLNALQAMPDGGVLEVETDYSEGLKVRGTFDDFVEIKMTDSGVGIPRENMEKIFEPFFSTKERGAGLGLAIVHSILDMHGGLISVNGRDGGGTVLTIVLPLATAEDGDKGGQIGSEGQGS